MEIEGLLFNRINEDFELFLKGTSKKRNRDFTDEEMTQLIESYEETILKDSLKKLHDQYPSFFKSVLVNQETISKEMEESFRYFFSYIYAGHTAYESIRKSLNTTGRKDEYQLLVPYYGSMIRLADQIGTMFINGYPDGAWRLLRSFHEYAAILLLFLKERDNENLASMFIDHYHRSKRKKAESFQKNYKDLKFEPLDKELLSQIQEQADEYRDRYGKDFLDDEYGWANEVFNLRRKVTFRDIEDHVGITKYRPFYIWASGFAHAGFESLFPFFDVKDKITVVLNKITRQSLELRAYIDPMQVTIALFHEVNLEFLKVYSVKAEYEINVLMFRRIFEAMLESFDKLNLNEEDN